MPPSLHRIYNDTLAKLSAVQCKAWAHVVLQRPNMLDIRLQVVQNDGDVVVASILRKLELATSQTCEVCCRPGILRSLSRSVRVLCGNCSGPRLAALALAQPIANVEKSTDDRQGNVVWWGDASLELRPALPAAAWCRAGIAGGTETTHATTHAQLRRYLPWLHAFGKALDHAVELQEPA